MDKNNENIIKKQAAEIKELKNITVKGMTLSAMLRKLNILDTHSRPHVSNDNPYIESFLGTMKIGIEFLNKGFRTKKEVEEWMEQFIEYYNNEKHSGIGYVTPNERFEGKTKRN